MKFIHTSDWHLGRRLGEHALIDDQRVFCDWLVDLAVTEGAELVVAQGGNAPVGATALVMVNACSV